MEDYEVYGHKKQAFWKGFVLCALLVLIATGYYGCQQISWYEGHTSTSPDELTKIAAVLDLGWQQEVKLVRYEFDYQPWWMDKFGSTASLIERTDKSPPWSEMLKNWERLDGMPSNFVRVRILNWAGDALDQSTPFYVRQIQIVRTIAQKGSGAITAYPMPQLCAAFFDKDNSQKLYVCTEGEIMLPETTIAATETSRTLDWSLAPWHSIGSGTN